MPESPFHIIFCGTPDFAVPALKTLIDHPDFEIDLVISQPDKPVGRSQTITPTPVKVAAEKAGITVFQPKDINEEFFSDQFAKTLEPDFLVTVAYGQILDDELLKFPKIAPVNIHASLLPRWRGASPIQHTILEDKTGGISIQQMISKLDTGPILAQKKIELDPKETSPSLHDKLAKMGADLLTKTLTKPLKPKNQDESEAVFCKKLTRKDGEVDTKKMTAEEIDRHVRALVPWPGVRCTVNGHEVKLIETSLEPTDDSTPVECKNNTLLHIISLQPPGKNRMTGKQWECGHKNN